MSARKRFCGMCDQMVVPDVAGDCSACGFETTAGNPYAGERERDEDDGRTYADPREELQERRKP